ncbi:MAG TPA: GAP family protein [Solirubrobacteraceae bacterium]|jgi:cytochrome c biogenesis protein CcdA
MLRLVGLVVSIGLADSLNPATIAPALYLGSGQHARRDVAEFTLAVFGVYLVGGLVIALGPGQLLLALVPHPGRHLSYVLEIVAGVAMVTAAAFLWGYRDRLGRPREKPKKVNPRGRSGAVLGATISAVELPTAFPYFAAIAAIVGSGYGVVRQIMFVLLFNICFIAPLLAILATLTIAGPDAQQLLQSGRRKLETHWPAVLSVVALVAGVFVILLGATGLASLSHNDFGSAARRLRHILHP